MFNLNQPLAFDKEYKFFDCIFHLYARIDEILRKTKDYV